MLFGVEVDSCKHQNKASEDQLIRRKICSKIWLIVLIAQFKQSLPWEEKRYKELHKSKASLLHPIV